MNVYRVDCGAYYWVAAPNIREAVSVIWKCWHDEGSEEDSDDGFSIGKVPRSKWPETYYDDGFGRPMSFSALVTKQTTATVLTCSEWP
ncbi:MAG: hypothetical protein GY926_19560 [bacterium]|nr:hypothetical protein [bacterium]